MEACNRQLIGSLLIYCFLLFCSRPFWGGMIAMSRQALAAPPRKNPFQLDKWGFTPHLAKLEWIFKGGAAGALLGYGDISPKLVGKRGLEGQDLPGRLR